MATRTGSSPDGLPDDSHLGRLPSKLSPSRAKEYLQCPKLFYYKTIQKLPTPNTIATARGTLAHSAFEMIFEHPRPERTLENALAYVRPAWKVLTEPFVSWEAVEPGTPEDLLRTSSQGYTELTKPGSYMHTRSTTTAADYLDLVNREASDRTKKAQGLDPAAVAVTAAEVEEELLSTAEDMVKAYFQMEKPEKFDPEGREVHVQATVLGVTLHGFIDRLDKVTTSQGEDRWYVSDYKGLALDTPIPTPAGWTTMGGLAVDDEIFGADGQITRVTGKSEVKNISCYRVEFDDGTSIVCDHEHRWQVQADGEEKVLDADALHALVTGGADVVIPNAAPLELVESSSNTLRGSILQRRDAVERMTGSSAEPADFVSASPQEADRLYELLVSLGFAPLREGLRIQARSGAVNRRVVAVVPVESVPTQCIMVDAPDHLYLAGRQMVPTHNTGKVPGEGKRYSAKMMAKIEEDAFFAMKIYALLLWKVQGILPYELRLLYVKTGDRQQGILTRRVTERMLNEAAQEMSKMWRDVKRDARREVWETKTGPLCNWCHFQPICPAFNDGVDGYNPNEGSVEDELLVLPEALDGIPGVVAALEDDAEVLDESAGSDQDL